MPIKSTAKTKKSTASFVPEETVLETAPAVKTTAKSDSFAAIIKSIFELQSEFEVLQKEISQTEEAWLVEQKIHKKDLEDRNIAEDLERKRSKEAYEYEVARKHKQEEDEFADKKASWEKDLREQQEILRKEKEELLELRRLVAGFESEKAKAVAGAQQALQTELLAKFDIERKLSEQEDQAEKNLLNLRITNLTMENNKLNTEIEALRKALGEATRQVKDIAVKVIESGTKPQSADVNSS